MIFNVLIAEDESDMRSLLESILVKVFLKFYPEISLKIESVENGSDAVASAKKQQKDIIFTDITMPIMNGIEATKLIRSFDKTVPILAITALSDTENISNIFDAGVNTYIEKPLNSKIFIAQIRMIVELYLKRKSKYNKDAINLFDKKVFRRKIEFFIERENDLIEFWEFMIEDFKHDSFEITDIISVIYDIQLSSIKNGNANIIIIEENLNNFYITLSDIETIEQTLIDKLEDSQITYLHQDESLLSFHLSKIVIVREDKNLKSKKTQTPLTSSKISASQSDDIHYSTNEYITAIDFMKEIDPSIYDKIDNFSEMINDLFRYVYNLENPEENPKENILSIADALTEFSKTLDLIGTFNVIVRSVKRLSENLRLLDINTLKDKDKCILLINSLHANFEDIEKWIDIIFISQSVNDIHYFDASFASNSYLIECLFEVIDYDDIEFF